MAPIVTVMALVLAIPAAVKATRVQTWSGTSCNSGDHLVFTGHSVNCQQLGNVKSFSVDNIDSGCSLTYYFDSNCSNGATLAFPGSCFGYADGRQVRSWSWDC